MCIAISSNFEEFTALKSDWDLISINSKYFLPFCCHDWFNIWLKNFSHDNDIFIVKVSRRLKPVAIVPLLAGKEQHRGINITKLELMGNVYSPVRSLLVDARQAATALETLFNYLISGNNSWDMLDLSTIPEESGLLEDITRELSRQSISFKEYLCFGDWYRDDIACSGDELISQLPDRMRKDIQYCKRRLEREGQLEIKVITSQNQLDAYLKVYYDVYARSWQQNERIGPTFHRDLAAMAVDKGWLRLGFLFHDGIPLAAQFWLVANGTAFILKTVYDQDFRKHSPGKILTAEMFKHVIDIDGVATIDYVQGDEGYKKDWTPKRRERRGILVYNHTYKGRYLSIVETKIAPFVKRNKYLGKLSRLLFSASGD